MTKRRGRKPKAIQVNIGQDPSLWRYANVHEALSSNTTLIARMIRNNEAGRTSSVRIADDSQSVSIPENT